MASDKALAEFIFNVKGAVVEDIDFFEIKNNNKIIELHVKPADPASEVSPAQAPSPGSFSSFPYRQR